MELSVHGKSVGIVREHTPCLKTVSRFSVSIPLRGHKDFEVELKVTSYSLREPSFKKTTISSMSVETEGTEAFEKSTFSLNDKSNLGYQIKPNLYGFFYRCVGDSAHNNMDRIESASFFLSQEIRGIVEGAQSLA